MSTLLSTARTSIFGDDDDDEELFTSIVNTSRFASTPSQSATAGKTAEDKRDKIDRPVVDVSSTAVSLIFTSLVE